MRTAREAFQQSSVAQEFSKFADSAAMDTATEYALLSLIEELPPAEVDPNTAWTQHAKVMGARRVLEILRTLHLKEQQPKAMRPPTLRPPS